jgi:hypothetical protein
MVKRALTVRKPCHNGMANWRERTNGIEVERAIVRPPNRRGKILWRRETGQAPSFAGLAGFPGCPGRAGQLPCEHVANPRIGTKGRFSDREWEIAVSPSGENSCLDMGQTGF